mmetsp:Transcript_27513/g.72499  ORF Transcript_27513/g.72499 Transcript_27513/m.72499 type:complete len:237 (-) Transcript_27513:806-1516(-)
MLAPNVPSTPCSLLAVSSLRSLRPAALDAVTHGVAPDGTTLALSVDVVVEVLISATVFRKEGRVPDILSLPTSKDCITEQRIVSVPLGATTCLCVWHHQDSHGANDGECLCPKQHALLTAVILVMRSALLLRCVCDLLFQDTGWLLRETESARCAGWLLRDVRLDLRRNEASIKPYPVLEPRRRAICTLFPRRPLAARRTLPSTGRGHRLLAQGAPHLRGCDWTLKTEILVGNKND